MITAYNNSAWLGEVPSDWRRTCVKRVADFSPSYSGGKPVPDEICTVVPMDAVSEFGAVRVESQEVFSDVTPGLTLFESGDVLFAKITPCMENGKGAQVSNLPTRYAFGSTEFHVMRPSHEIDGKFLYFATFNPFFRAWAEKNMQGAAGQQRVTTRFLKYSTLPLPPLAEQKRIAAYLDASCAAIDRAVETKRKQLETLDALRKSIIQKAVTQGLNPKVKLKDSGAVHLGPLPQHWKVRRVKDVFEFHNHRRIPISSADRGVMSDRIYDYYGASGAIDKVENFIFDGRYILLAEDGANLLSRSKQLAFFAEGQFWVNNHAHIIKPWRGNEIYWVNLLEAQDYSLAVTGSAQPKLNMQNFGRFQIPVPPVAEQNEIADFVVRRSAEFDKVKDTLVAQLTTLTAYRKSLIHECVTGKRRISAADVAKVEAHR